MNYKNKIANSVKLIYKIEQNYFIRENTQITYYKKGKVCVRKMSLEY